jgi:UDP-N-acetylglucosamine--N-acetylmuramyl-(pentapeptide) pyrophosphoryl-undecaprenol N-acetylglucosamine transferase
MRVWAVAGGTGGHFYPALAVAEEMENRIPGITVRFAVSRRGLEARVLNSSNRPFRTFMVEGFHRREVLRNLLFPFRTAAGFVQSILEVIRFKPDVAFGTGGFVSGPGLLAAWCLGVPIALVALDALPGVTIRILAPVARKIYVTHHQAVKSFSRRIDVEAIGIPVRPTEPLERRMARERLGLPIDATVLFVTGGSHGSATLNSAVTGALPALMEIPQLTVLWQTGTSMLEEVIGTVDTVLKASRKADRERVILHPYLDDMAAAWHSSDLALCRAGASTIAELALYGVPSLLVPLSTAAGDHQEANALAMVEAGAARHLPEKELTADRLLREFDEIMAGEGLLERMAEAASDRSESGGACRVAEGLVSIARRLNDTERAELLALLQGAGQ